MTECSPKVQPRSQGLFPGLGTGPSQGKDPGNEVAKSAKTVQIWLSSPAWLMGNTFCRILYFLILLIALREHVFSNLQFPESLLLDPLKTVPDQLSFITKPLSAITLSPLSSNMRIPYCLMISLSDMPPVYNWDTNLTLPEGAIPNRALAVVVLLYFEKIWHYLNKEEGGCILNSVASRITVVKGNFLKLSGIVSWNVCLGNQKLIEPKTK